MAELLPNIVFVTDALGQATYFNQRWYDYTGLTAEQALDGGWHRALHPDDVERTMAAWTTSVQTGLPYEVEYRFRAADGTYRWFLGRGNPVRADGGAIVQWVGSCTDIEQEKQLASALQEKVAWFERLANAVPQLIWIADSDGRIEYVNSRWRDTFDEPLETIRAHAAWPYIHPDDKDHVEHAWRAARDGNTVWERELRMRVKNGTYRWFLVRGNPVEDRSGKIVRWFGTTTDIDAQRRLVQDLSENVEYVRLLTEVLPAVLWTAAPNGTVLSLSKNFYELTGHDSNRPPETWVEALHPDDHEVLELYVSGIASSRPFANENRLRAADGSYRWHYTKASPVLNSDGHVSSWVGITFDTDALRQRQDTLEADFRREQQVSRLFQETALPKKLPAVPGVTFNAIYRSAESAFYIGGDWYDAFSLRDDSLMLSIGDAMGSGIKASTTMSATRRGIRSVAQVERDPSRILDAVDEVLQLEERDVMATAFVGRLLVSSRTLSFASAGHPPALVRYRDGHVAALPIGGLPLGYRHVSATATASETVELSDADLLVLYTDGLTEADRDAVEGERKLRAAIEGIDLADTSDVAAYLAKKLVGKATDDLAILVVRWDADGK
jgi:PAS domain S-box-containing protein